jgi:hypothetical protein
MPTPSGLKISLLPSGLRPAGYDLLAIVQGGNTVQIPVSGIRINTTAELPESGNLYYTNARARAALSAGPGIFYNSSEGIIALDGAIGTPIEQAYKKSVKSISVLDEGRSKTVVLTTQDDTPYTASWIDRGQDVSVDGTHGLSSTYDSAANLYTLMNSDRGSDQYIFKSINVSGSNNIVAK